jgi:hypothetical protein
MVASDVDLSSDERLCMIRRVSELATPSRGSIERDGENDRGNPLSGRMGMVDRELPHEAFSEP